MARVASRPRGAQERRKSRKEDGGRRTRRRGTNGGTRVGARGRMKRLLLLAFVTACGRSSPPPDTSWHQADGYRWRALDVPRGRITPGFTLLDPSRTGITFSNTVSESLLARNRILADGAGVCLADVDGDGRPDVFLVSTEGPSALYRNLGDWRFEDITRQAGVAAPGRYATGCAFADVDGDGDQDLLLVSLGGPNVL